MSTHGYFVASDYDLNLQLQELFHETMLLQAKLDEAEREKAKLQNESHELNLKLKDAHNEISQLVIKMKHLLSDSEIVMNPDRQTISASKRTFRLQKTE
jgi:chromosome segregation ATPase